MNQDVPMPMMMTDYTRAATHILKISSKVLSARQIQAVIGDKAITHNIDGHPVTITWQKGTHPVYYFIDSIYIDRIVAEHIRLTLAKIKKLGVIVCVLKPMFKERAIIETIGFLK
jgi:hypothetical protein